MEPIELELPSLRIVLQIKTPKVEWIQARYVELNLLDKQGLQAAYEVVKK